MSGLQISNFRFAIGPSTRMSTEPHHNEKWRAGGATPARRALCSLHSRYFHRAAHVDGYHVDTLPSKKRSMPRSPFAPTKTQSAPERSASSRRTRFASTTKPRAVRRGHGMLVLAKCTSPDIALSHRKDCCCEASRNSRPCPRRTPTCHVIRARWLFRQFFYRIFTVLRWKILIFNCFAERARLFFSLPNRRL